MKKEIPINDEYDFSVWNTNIEMKCAYHTTQLLTILLNVVRATWIISSSLFQAFFILLGVFLQIFCFFMASSKNNQAQDNATCCNPACLPFDSSCDAVTLVVAAEAEAIYYE